MPTSFKVTHVVTHVTLRAYNVLPLSIIFQWAFFNFQDSGVDSVDAGEINYRRQQILKYGRESRHNVISRRDNLILSPDRPPTLQVNTYSTLVTKFLKIHTNYT